MPCCRVNTLNLCSVPVCGNLELPKAATAPQDSGAANVYTLVLDFLSTTISLISEQVEGQNIKFSIASLNENFEYTGKVYDADGNLVTFGESDCIKFKTIISLYAATATARPPLLVIANTVIIQSIIDESVDVSGTTLQVTGLSSGSNAIVSDAFIGVRVMMIRGNIPIPGINPLDGSNYFTKVLGSNEIILNFDLVAGEFIRIQTIP